MKSFVRSSKEDFVGFCKSKLIRCLHGSLSWRVINHV